ncbi:MAG: hypothetical protein ACK4TN_04635, partial [Brevinematales bacterium]
MDTLFSFLFPTMVSVFLIFYFRKIDKKNVQLQTLKNFVQHSIQEIQRLFEAKQKELYDKTINLDVSLQKLDKATQFINQKLGEFKDFMDKIKQLEKSLEIQLKAAQAYEKDLSAMEARMAQLVALEREMEEMKQELAEAKKLTATLLSDIDQSRVWAQDNVKEIMKNTESSIEAFRKQIQDRIQSFQLEKTFQTLQNEIQQKSIQLQQVMAQVEQRIRDQEIASQKEADKIFSQNKALFAKQLEAFRQEAETQLLEKARALEVQFLEGIKRLEHQFNTSVKLINQKLSENDQHMKEQKSEIGKEFQNLRESINNEVQYLSRVIETQKTALQTMTDEYQKALELKTSQIDDYLEAFSHRLTQQYEEALEKGKEELIAL